MLSTATVAQSTTYAGGRGSCSRRSSRATTDATEPGERIADACGAGRAAAGVRPRSSRRRLLHHLDVRPRRRSRRRARRSPAYASNDAHAGESSTTSPGRASRAARPAPRRASSATVSTGVPVRANAAAISGPASPNATTPRRRAASAREHREVEALVAAAREQHDRVERRDRAPGRVGVRRLRVVVPLHPTSFADQRDAVGHGRVRRERGARCRRRSRRPRARPRPAASAFVRSCASARAHDRDRRERPRRRGTRARSSTTRKHPVGVGAAGEPDPCAPARAAAIAAASSSSASNTSRSSAVWCAVIRAFAAT